MTQWVKRGKIELEADGKIDPDKADTQRGARVQPRITVTKAAPAAGDGPDFFEERARHERAKADLAELKAQERAGELVELEEVKRLWATLATETRDRLLGLPDRLAEELHAAETEHEVREVLRRELTEALSRVDPEHAPGA